MVGKIAPAIPRNIRICSTIILVGGWERATIPTSSAGGHRPTEWQSALASVFVLITTFIFPDFCKIIFLPHLDLHCTPLSIITWGRKLFLVNIDILWQDIDILRTDINILRLYTDILRLDTDILRLDINILRPDINILRPDINQGSLLFPKIEFFIKAVMRDWSFL